MKKTFLFISCLCVFLSSCSTLNYVVIDKEKIKSGETIYYFAAADKKSAKALKMPKNYYNPYFINSDSTISVGDTIHESFALN